MTRAARTLIVMAVTAVACGGPAADDAPPADGAARGGADSSAGAAPRAPDQWPEAGPVDHRRERVVDLRGEGTSETVVVTARGPSYDSLDIVLTIIGEDSDTLWLEAWPSLLYFKYDGLDGKADTTVARIVSDHVEHLFASDRFNMGGGLPAVLGRGADPDALMREAIHYHLAELDWRRAAGLSPAAATPLEAYTGISTDGVAVERVEEVLGELRARPSFMYYAGGEATYAIAWSDRENAFVRIHSCC